MMPFVPPFRQRLGTFDIVGGRRNITDKGGQAVITCIEESVARRMYLVKSRRQVSKDGMTATIGSCGEHGLCIAPFFHRIGLVLQRHVCAFDGSPSRAADKHVDGACHGKLSEGWRS